MKRDMDFIRELLLRIESGDKVFETVESEVASFLGIELKQPVSKEDAKKVEGHLGLLERAGLVDIEGRAGGGITYVEGLTWAGHDLLDAIRDPKIWEKTKKGAEAAGGFTVDLLRDLAKGFLKKQVEELTGVKL